MSDDWDVDDEPVNSSSSIPAQAAIPPPRPVARRFAGEDEDDDGDDWDKSDDEKKPKPGATTSKSPSVPAPKKMTLKQKIAEKERLAAESRLSGSSGNELMEEMTEQDRRRLAREKELAADMAVAAELMGTSSLEDRNEAIKAVLTANPKSKSEFNDLSQSIITAVISRHVSNPLFPAFIEQLAKDMCESLNAVQTRKVSSTLSILGNTKQQEERDKASGKKKAAAKPKLGSTKALGAGKIDTEAYDDVLDDDDFM